MRTDHHPMDDDWRDHAACRGEDPELFFPVGTTGPALDQIDAAKAVCQRCPVIAECLSWALRNGEAAGIWGGTTPEERRRLRHRRGPRSVDVVRRVVDDDDDEWPGSPLPESGHPTYAASAASRPRP